MRSARDLGLLLGWLINESLLDLVEMKMEIRTEEGISSIRPTNEFNITGVIYHPIKNDSFKKRNEVIRQFSINLKHQKSVLVKFLKKSWNDLSRRF